MTHKLRMEVQKQSLFRRFTFIPERLPAAIPMPSIILTQLLSVFHASWCMSMSYTVSEFPLSICHSLNSTQSLSSFIHVSTSFPENLSNFFTFLSVYLIIRKCYKFFNFRCDFLTHAFILAMILHIFLEQVAHHKFLSSSLNLYSKCYVAIAFQSC